MLTSSFVQSQVDSLDLRRMSKVCLITGGTQGIGRATAELLVSQGWTVIVSGRNTTKGDEVRLYRHLLINGQ